MGLEFPRAQAKQIYSFYQQDGRSDDAIRCAKEAYQLITDLQGLDLAVVQARQTSHDHVDIRVRADPRSIDEVLSADTLRPYNFSVTQATSRNKFAGRLEDEPIDLRRVHLNGGVRSYEELREAMINSLPADKKPYDYCIDTVVLGGKTHPRRAVDNVVLTQAADLEPDKPSLVESVKNYFFPQHVDLLR